MINSIFSRRKRPMEEKADPIAKERAYFIAGATITGDPKSRKTIEDIYCHPILFRCVDLIAGSASSVPWIVHDASGAVETHPYNRLLSKANNEIDGASLLYHLIASYIATGSSYILAALSEGDGTPVELWPIESTDMSIKYDDSGQKVAYVYKDKSTGKRIFPIDENGRSSEIMRLTRVSVRQGRPLGHRHIEAVEKEAHLYDSLSRRVIGLSDNSINMSGILNIEDGDITDEQYNMVKAELQNFRNGAKRSGDLAITRNLQTTFTSLSKGYEFDSTLEQQREAARTICTVFGVPPMLLGIPGDNTYSNYRAARTAFWTDTIIPFYIAPIQRSLSSWLFEEGDFEVRAQLDEVPALLDQMNERREKIDGCTFMTINEKRRLFGLEPLDDGDRIILPSNATSFDELVEGAGP